MAEARGRAVQLETAKLDVTLASDREAVFNRFGESVDVVVCNAAVGEGGPLAELPTERLRSQFEVNVFSQLDFVQPYAAAMVAKGAGKIVFLSSIAGLYTVPYLGAYCMSKHAVEAMALTLRQELASSGVKVCVPRAGPQVPKPCAESAVTWLAHGGGAQYHCATECQPHPGVHHQPGALHHGLQ